MKPEEDDPPDRLYNNSYLDQRQENPIGLGSRQGVAHIPIWLLPQN